MHHYHYENSYVPYEIIQMRTVAADVARNVVCVSVSLGNNRERWHSHLYTSQLKTVKVIPEGCMAELSSWLG